MEKIMNVIHWGSYCYYIYVFGYASLFKVFQKPSMMESMKSLGFDRTWTIAIGIGELVGVLMVLSGLLDHRLKTTGILFLFPFAVGAFTAHMAHQEYQYFYNALTMCILTFVLLWTDRHFKIII